MIVQSHQLSMATQGSMLRIVLGTVEMGRRSLVQDAPCFALMESYLARKYSYKEIDTALMYCDGESEKKVGRYIKDKGLEDKVTIATKANPWKRGLSQSSVLEQAAISLKSLQTPCMDVYYLHAPDHNTPIEETLETLQQLYEAGKFKELGLSNYTSWQVADIYHICKRNGWVLPTVYQGMYNPITRMVEGELFPALRHFGIRFYAYNILAGGMLSGKYNLGDEKNEPEGRFFKTGGHWAQTYRDRWWRETVFKGLGCIKKALTEAYGPDQMNLVRASTRWIVNHSLMKPEYNDGIILGGSSLPHLVSNMDYCEEGPLDKRVVDAFDEAWDLDKGNCTKSSNVTTIYNYLQTQDDKVKEQKLSNYWQKNTDMFKQNPNFIDGVIIPSPESQVREDDKEINGDIHSCQSLLVESLLPFCGKPTSFHFTKNGGQQELIFLSSGTLYCDRVFNSSGSKIAEDMCSIQADDRKDSKSWPWKKLYNDDAKRQLNRSEQFLRERMRTAGNGISSYDFIQDKDWVVVHGPRCIVLDRKTGDCVAEFPELAGAVDHQICPSSAELLACVYEGDVWLLDAKRGKIHSLTHTADNRKETKLSAGHPSFVIQEEFKRFTGLWWQAQDTGNEIDSSYRILYEEVDEREVEVLHTFNPNSQTTEGYSYPRPGRKNAKSSLKLLEFSFSQDGQLSKTTKSLCWELSELFPDCSEYVVRVGWMPDGNHIWIQLLNRPQTQLKIVVVSIEAFILDGHSDPTLRSADAVHTPLVYELLEENSDVWINVADIFKFLPTSEPDAPIHFIWSSEASGYRHLCLVKATPPKTRGKTLYGAPKATTNIQQLTSGDWVVFGSEIWVDLKRKLVYFEANKSSCLEKHLYAISLESDELPCDSPIQLTTAGYDHQITMDSDCSCFVSVNSNESNSPRADVFSIKHNALSAELVHTLWKAAPLPSGYAPPTRFQVSSHTGETLHGVVYAPSGLERGAKYPTVLHVYGGPQFQLNTNALSSLLPNIHTWTKHGFAVVMLDGRGSYNRGIKFESYLKGHLGSIEVHDQVAGLKKAAETVDYIDIDRVAITGWSYGGYVSLLSIAKKPDVFKLAIAGAPVTDWMNYDTGFTERYLQMLPEAKQAYLKSSVLSYSSEFPTEPNRLLIVHGLSDDNVLFMHTAMLCNELVQHGKPYQLQLYIGEGHLLRSPSSAVHCSATELNFLLKNL